MLVCNDVCIPETAEIELKLNDPAEASQDNTAIINAAKEKMPPELAGTFTFSEADKKLVMRLTPPKTRHFFKTYRLKPQSSFLKNGES
jgi:DsbC/DsbD-like thiol-disulfide interchange protein